MAFRFQSERRDVLPDIAPLFRKTFRHYELNGSGQLWYLTLQTGTRISVPFRVPRVTGNVNQGGVMQAVGGSPGLGVDGAGQKKRRHKRGASLS